MPLLIDRLAVGLGYDTKGVRAGEGTFKKSLGRITGFLKTPLGMVVALGAALGVVGFKAVRTASKWEQSWGEVVTIMSGTEAGLADIEKKLLNIGKIVPQEEGLLAKGFYQTISSGIIDAGEALFFTERAAKAATGGLTDVFTSVDAGTTIMNAFGMEIGDTDRIFDLLFTTVREGKVQFGELAQTVGIAIPFFAQAGISIEDLLSSMATLTKVGLRAPLAVTALRATITQLLKPAEDAIRLSRKLGIEFNTEAVAAMGLVPWLADVAEKTRGSTKAIGTLFPNVRGMAGVLTLAGKAAKEFARIQDVLVTKSAGNAQRAFEIMTNTLDGQQKLLKNQFNRAWIAVGKRILPVVTGAFRLLLDGTLGRGGQFGLAIDNVRLLKEESTNLAGEVQTLADRYDSLVASGMTVDESEELRDVVAKLSNLYPELISRTDQYGQVVELNTERLKALREETDLQASKAARDLFEERNKQIRKHQDRIERLSHAMNVLAERDEQFNSPKSIRAMQRALSISLIDPNKIRDATDLLRILRQEQAFLLASQKGLIQQRSQVVQAAGLEDLVLRWSNVRKQIEGGADLLPVFQRLTDELALTGIFPLDNIKKAQEQIREIAEDLERIVDQGKIEGPRIPGPGESPFVEGPLPAPDAAAVAKEHVRELERLQDELLKNYIENQTKARFATDAAFDAMDQDVKDFYQNWMDENEKAMKKMAEEATKDLEERLRVQRGMVRQSLRSEFEERRKLVALFAAEEAAAIAGPQISELLGLKAPNLRDTDFEGPPTEGIREFELAVVELEATMGDSAREILTDWERVMSGSKQASELLAKIPEKVRTEVASVLRGRLESGDLSIEQEVELERFILALEATGEAAGDVFGNVENATRGLLQLGEGAEFVDEKTAAALSGLINFGSAMEQFANKTLGPGGLIAAGLGLITAIIAGGQGRAGAEQKRVDEQAAKDRVNSAKIFRDAVNSFREAVQPTGANLLTAAAEFEEKILFLFGLWTDFPDSKGLIGNFKKELVNLFELFPELFEGIFDTREELNEFLKGATKEQILELLRAILGDINEQINDFALIMRDTMGGVLNALDREFELFDITDQAEKLRRYIEELTKFTDGVIDLSGLLGKTPEEIERATELIAGLVTGLMPGLRGEGSLGDQVAATEQINELAMILGMTFDETVELLNQFLTGQMTEEELLEFLAALESLGDDILAAQPGEDGPTEVTVSRNVSITEEQGMTIISLANTRNLILSQSLAVLEQIEAGLPAKLAVGAEIEAAATATRDMILDTAAQVARSAVSGMALVGGGGDHFEIEINVEAGTPTSIRDAVSDGVADGVERIKTLRRAQGITRGPGGR